MLEGAEVYGLGSWSDIADHVGGMRSKEEVRDHYIKTYVETNNFPLPNLADPFNLMLSDEIPRDEFQARKKRRIEERKEEQKNSPPAPPKQKPTASIPSCHEVQGYMPGRLEFETELHNEAEEAVQHMQFDPGEGAANPRTGTYEPEFELKMVIMDIYNSKLTARAQRKKLIFEHNLLEYRKNAALDKKRTKEERELFGKVKPFCRMSNHGEFLELAHSVDYEHNLRLAIAQLQDWRHHGIGDLKTGEKYEAEKAQRVARPAATGAFDRMPGARPPKQQAEPKVHTEAMDFVAPELPDRLKPKLRPALASTNTNLPNGIGKNALTTSTLMPQTSAPRSSQVNGISGNHASINPLPRSLYTALPVPGTKPIELHSNDHSDVHLLTVEEKELCGALRLMPKAYLVIKDAMLKEATKQGGGLKKKAVRDLCKVEAARGQRVWEFLVRAGWVSKG